VLETGEYFVIRIPMIQGGFSGDRGLMHPILDFKELGDSLRYNAWRMEVKGEIKNGFGVFKPR
jgi:hypothetical protein